MSSDRIEQIDVIRGIAVLGILLMNIRTFSEPSAAYFNPLVYGDYSGLNALWWNFQAIFADQKFMAIFSMLFGASTAIICDSLQRKNLPVVNIYAKRIFILFIIGCLHAYLLWRGDILVIYALSNYIFQTIMCTSMFYGYGGELFGKLERIETAIIVIGVWATQIILSNIWFQTFTKGPLESIWSRLTYSKWSKAK